MSPPNSTSRPEFAQDSPIDAILMDATENDPSRNASSTKRSLLETFLDSFFHPSNIRWLLVIGASIVLASSVMLVSREWNHWHNAIKFLTILGYTGTIFVASQLARNRLGLPTTSEVLDGLTLLLLPLSTLALRWLTDQAGTGSALALGEHLSLLGLAIALTLLASRSIFDRWLRGRQPTFQMAYVALVAAGSLPILADPWWGAGFFGLIWAIMTIGAIKVNRHLFWLVEEHRLPRVFGFFPIALLGMEFLLLVISKTMHSIHLEWFGVGCTLVSITFLLTARSASNVYRQRMGGIDHALPIHLAVPLVVGLALLAAGAMLSLYGFHYVGPTTYAAVPNALMAAIILWLVAGDTRLSVFAWTSLLCATFAYQSSPTLFSDLVSVLKSQAATAVQEDRLPLAFYGLTYLPWLVLLAVASRLPRVAARPEFSQPLRQLATVLGLLLFVVSLSHLKALFIVSLVDSLLFTFFALWWKDRRYLLVTLIASFVASASLVPFLHAMQLAHLHPAHLLTSISLWSIIMIVGGIHRWISSIPISERTDVFSRYLLLDRHQQHRDIARSAGFFVSIAMPYPCIVLGAMNLAGTWDSNVIAPIAMSLLSLALYSWWTGTYWMGLFQSFVLASFTFLLLVAHGFDDPVSLVGLAMILPPLDMNGSKEYVDGHDAMLRAFATPMEQPLD